jgi:hypothetical protein
MAREDQLDFRVAQRLEKIQILLTGDAEDELDAFGFETTDEQVGGLHIGIP